MSRQPGIVNIINFIRGIEPRPGRNIDLIEPVVHQIELAKKHKLPVTWLLQYDAMIDPRFRDLMKTIQPEDEIGIWIEFVQPLVEKACLKWRGRWSWDWHVNCGFSVGYTPDERKHMLDILIDDFHLLFGRTPTAAGSWLIDAVSLAHLETRGLIAFCNCKDQWGTDGYTLWGGYYNQAYYASTINAYIPAQTPDMQINVPIFRMLGCDPIQQYESDIHGNGQNVITLEPISPRGGMRSEWTDNFLHQMFDLPSLSFGYAQVGQENSFGWPRMASGLTYQCQRIQELRDHGTIRIETLTDSGRWFKKTYSTTPASTIIADHDIDYPAQGATWFYSRYYRASLMWDSREFRMRDIQLFDQRRAEPFLNTSCTSNVCKYDALPVMDAFLWRSKPDSKSGIRIINRVTGEPYILKNAPTVTEYDDKTLVVSIDDKFTFTFKESLFEIRSYAAGLWDFVASWDANAKSSFIDVKSDHMLFCHESYEYAVAVRRGAVHCLPNGYRFTFDADGMIQVAFNSDFRF